MVIQCTHPLIEEQAVNRIYMLFQIYFLYHMLLFKSRFAVIGIPCIIAYNRLDHKDASRALLSPFSVLPAVLPVPHTVLRVLLRQLQSFQVLVYRKGCSTVPPRLRGSVQRFNGVGGDGKNGAVIFAKNSRKRKGVCGDVESVGKKYPP